MNSRQQRILKLLEQWVEDWKAIIDGIERGSTRYYEDNGQGQVDVTGKTLRDYQRRVVDAKELIAKFTAESR